MEQLVTVKKMQERYGCSLPTARKYIRQCVPHMENPLAATERSVAEWERKRTVYPTKALSKQKKEELVRQIQGVKVPRRR